MIEIKDECLKDAAQKGMDDFIGLITDKYLELIGDSLTAEKMGLLSGEQHALLSYRIFRDEVMEGGFVQLIQNGYGSYIFDNPFAKAMRLWGAKDLTDIIYKAQKVFLANRKDLEKQRDNDDDFMAMYENYEAFDDLEDNFLEIEEQMTAIVAAYVDEHLELFAKVVK